MEQRSAIPWCDRRRMYCASGCSLRDKLSNSGACDWAARAAALPPVAYSEADRQPPDLDRQPRSDADRQPRSNVDRQPRSQEPARPSAPRNQQHPRAKFDNSRRKGPGAQRKPNDSAAAAVVAAAAAPAAAPAAAQPDMFTAPPAIQQTIAPALAVAVDSPVAERPASND